MPVSIYLPPSGVTLSQCLSNASNCDCSDPSNTNCYIRNLLTSESDRYNKFFSSLELLGIPQVLIQNNAPQYIGDQSFITCISSPITPIPGTLNPAHNPTTQSEYQDTPNRHYYKASDEENFSSSLKKVFSEDKVTCCVPPGSVVSADTSEDSCCSGTISRLQGGQQVCCLEDYTNLTVFFNRYVSSMLSDLPDNRFDPFTGRPIYASDVFRVATSKNVCCSGNIALGTAFSAALGVPKCG